MPGSVSPSPTMGNAHKLTAMPSSVYSHPQTDESILTMDDESNSMTNDESKSTAMPGSISQPLMTEYITSTEMLGNVPTALAVVADEFDSTRRASPPVMFVKIEIGFNSND